MGPHAGAVAAILAAFLLVADGARSRKHRTVPDPSISIVNGTDAPACKWKWQVGLYSRGSSRPFCGGTLISPSWVVTAKHCVSGSIDVLGGDILPGRGQRRSSKRVVRRAEADLALIELSSPFDLNDCLNVPTLPQNAVAPGQACWITGWGQIRNNGPSPTTLQQAETRVISESECRRGGARLESGDVCLLSGDSRSACRGDSGGPLVCQIGGQWILYGATSRGTGAPSPPCSDINIYAGVYDAMSWISSYVPVGPTPTPTPPTPNPPTPPTPTPPTPTPTPSPPAPTPPTGDCEHEKDCNVSPWCRDTGLEAWCRNQGQFGSCPAPYCKRA